MPTGVLFEAIFQRRWKRQCVLTTLPQWTKRWPTVRQSTCQELNAPAGPVRRCAGQQKLHCQ